VAELPAIRVLIAEPFHLPTLASYVEANPDLHLHEALEAAARPGINLYYQPKLSPASVVLAPLLPGFDALMVRPKSITADDIAAADLLTLIIRGGAGVNAIAVEAARAKGIVVQNTPGQNSVSTAEFTLALLMELTGKRQIHTANRDVMTGAPRSPRRYSGTELCGKRVGLIGFGAIGKVMARMLRGLEMPVAVYSRSLTDAQAAAHDVQRVGDLSVLLASCAVVSLHVPLTPDTHHLLNAGRLCQMQSETVLINTARPALIDPEGLAVAMEQGHIGGFGLDGDVQLPGQPEENTLTPYLRVVERFTEIPALLTPHIADTTDEAQAKVTRQSLDQLLLFFREGKVVNGV
jgi:phosphoglycerate dehydrogenase-like enzyme